MSVVVVSTCGDFARDLDLLRHLPGLERGIHAGSRGHVDHDPLVVISVSNAGLREGHIIGADGQFGNAIAAVGGGLRGALHSCPYVLHRHLGSGDHGAAERP